MEMTVGEGAGEITLGPVLFNWQPERWRDFYFRIAEEAPVATVTIGEAICSKRDPLFEPYYAEVAERLTAAGKTVVFSTLAQVVLKHDRTLMERSCAGKDFLIEANDGSALSYLSGRPHHIGPFMNVYNERTAAFLAGRGARNFCLPPEMPATAIAAMCDATHELDVTIEVQVFGRLPLALSARCYHARAHGRTKDSCQYVCENDADGMVLKTLDGRAFLAVNGIQTLSYDYLNLIGELPNLRNIGVSRFRLSPHDCDMVAVATLFRAVLDQRLEAAEAVAKLEAMPLGAPFSNGFYYGKPGYSWKAPAAH
jgi:O2-independent ubiquinone biosynthesis protein UbiV